MMTRELRHALHLHAARGGKTSRRRQIKRVMEFVDWCGCDPRQIGKSHVYRYFEAHAFAPTTARDHWYAIKLLWTLLKRPNPPPKPSLPLNHITQ